MRRAITRGHAAVAAVFSGLLVVFSGLLLALAACGSGAAPAGHAASSPGHATSPADDASPARTTSPAAVSSPAAAGTGAAAMQGPRVPDAACQAAVRAQRKLETSQVRDKTNATALDADFTAFANALTADAGRETSTAAAQAMNNLANDYIALVQSQSGAAQLPSMSTVQDDGAAFNRDCGG